MYSYTRYDDITGRWPHSGEDLKAASATDLEIQEIEFRALLYKLCTVIIIIMMMIIE